MLLLTELACRSAKATGNPVKYADAKGLYLFVTPGGLKSWRMKYRFDGKEKKLTFGRYPEMSLREARRARDEAKQLIRNCKDPSLEKQRDRQKVHQANANSFRAVADEWWAMKSPGWTPRYARRVKERIAMASSSFGEMPISDVPAMKLLSCMQVIQQRGARSMASRVLQICDNIFAYGIATERCETNPAAAIRSVVAKPVKRKRPAVLSIDQARAVLKSIEQSKGMRSTLLASRLIALTAARPGMVRSCAKAEFEDLDGKSPLWRIPAAKMKLVLEAKADSRYDFIIPLSRQAAATVKVALTINPESKLLLPSDRSLRKPVSDSTLGKLYLESGFRDIHVPHGWRTSFSTIMNEWAAEKGQPGDRAIIDLMLAHMPDNVETTYNRAAYMPRRRQLAQLWADMLLQGAKPPESLLPPS